MATFEKIAFTEVGSGGAADITFSSILSSWTDLCIMLSLRSTDSNFTFQNGFIKVNGVTTSQSFRDILGSGSGTPTSISDTPLYTASIPYALATASTFSNISIYIPNYAGSTNKSISIDAVGENNATAGRNQLMAGLYASSSPVTSISFTMNQGNLAQYSTATLYGIKKA
jgi:hypothetical protein